MREHFSSIGAVQATLGGLVFYSILGGFFVYLGGVVQITFGLDDWHPLNGQPPWVHLSGIVVSLLGTAFAWWRLKAIFARLLRHTIGVDGTVSQIPLPEDQKEHRSPHQMIVGMALGFASAVVMIHISVLIQAPAEALYCEYLHELYCKK